ncbi:MAG: YihY/virulence factor BrkB family protein [Anaerolineae bacterium]|nr:YihY/virulence factor BrkB family protein [Anaerolineae bacterium]
MTVLRSISVLFRETVHEWMEDGGAHIAASLAYYAIFSLSPLLIIISLALGLVMDQNTLESGLVSNLQTTVGQQAADLIRSMLRSETRSADAIGTIVWLSIIVWGASGMFAQLQNALNKIWEVRAKPGRSPLVLIKNRLMSFGIVLLAAVALLGTMVINTALSTMVSNGTVGISVTTTLKATNLFASTIPLAGGSVMAIRAIQLVLTLTISTGLIAVVYRVLPDVDIAWRDVIVGSLFTAVLLFIGQFAVGIYLSRANIGSVFGAAGSLTIILVWVYYSAQILLFGAEFTEVWARHYGSYIRPDEGAVWENEYKARREATKAGRDWSEIERQTDEG